MEVARDLLLFLHLLGMGALFGGAVVQLRTTGRHVNPAMLYGALLQVFTGLLLVGVLEADAAVAANHAKIAVKFTLSVLLTLLLFVNRRKPAIPDGLYYGLLGMTVATVAVAVVW